MVRRQNRTDRSEFWGCSTYPVCRGTQVIEAPVTDPPVVSAPLPSAPPAHAGGSARRSYERRLAKHQDEVRARRPAILAAGGGLMATGVVLLSQGSTLPFLGIALILFGAAWTLAELFAKPSHVRAWRIGAEGEEEVGRLLDRLTSDGYRVLHDRRRPGGRENIDHVVIGPPGVLVVETKHYRGEVRTRRGELVINGRRKTEFVDQVHRQRVSVAAALDLPAVFGVICVVGGDFPLFGSITVGGIDVVPMGKLTKRLRSMPTVLTPGDVERLAATAIARLPAS
jgi:hypothetical protein